MYFRGLLFFLFAHAAVAQTEGTALAALKLLPKDSAKRLARIEGRDGAPVPERWYLLVYDSEAERGVREFVVAGGKVVAVRTLSQFADALQPSDAVGADSVRVDSAHIARWAELFATANGGRLGSINYQLQKDPAMNGPVWIATVLDPEGDQIGSITVNAQKGGILSSDGFDKSPPPELLTVPAEISATLPGQGSASRVRVVPPTPTPRPNLLRRIFGSSEPKPPKTAR